MSFFTTKSDSIVLELPQLIFKIYKRKSTAKKYMVRTYFFSYFTKSGKKCILMHILHFEMSISASRCAIIISNIHLLMYCWNKLQHMQHKNSLIFSLML